MVTVNGTLLKNQLNLDDNVATVTEAEYSLDGAVNLLNTFGAGLDSLTGTAGSKTGTYTSAETGAILVMAKEIYKQHFNNAAGANINVAAVGVSIMADVNLLSMARQLANRLRGYSFVKY